MSIFKKATTKKAKPVVKESATVNVSKTSSEKKTMIAKNVLLKPVVTEKTSQAGLYCFQVAVDTNKQEVAKAFTAVYGKTPRRVNIVNVRGKSVRFGRSTGKQANWKKAFVYLTKGEAIDLFKN